MGRILSSLLDDAARQWSRRAFLVAEREWTYGEVAACSRCLAEQLIRRGLRRGDRVVVVSQNRAETVIVLFAAARMGAIFTLLQAVRPSWSLAEILAQIEPAALFVDSCGYDLLPRATPASLIWRIEDLPLADADLGTSAKSVAEGPIDLDPACLIFTSGSTGVSRGVALSHDNILFVTAAIQERLGYRSSDCIGLFLPMSFDYGLYQVFLAAQVGANLFVGDASMAGPGVLNVLEEQRVTVLPGVPSLFAGILKLLMRRSKKLPDLRILTNTGERLSPENVARLQHFLPEVSIYLMYGLTECKRVSILLPGELSERPESVGRPLDGTEVFVVDPHGRRLPAGEKGELWVHGRHVALGYWRAEEESAARFRRSSDGLSVVLATGDYGRLDEEGFIYFEGRADDLIKHKGYRIHPDEIVTAACGISGLLEAGVVQVEPSHDLVLVATTVDSTLTPATIRQRLAQQLEPYRVPDVVLVVDHLPKTGNGKVAREALARVAQEGIR